jgi:glycerate 2-kinase
MKILIAPTAFKHSLTPRAAAEAIARGLRRSGLEAELVLLPIADGGNGTLDAFLANGGRRVNEMVLDPLERPFMSAYGILADGETAVIEMALASGLELLRPGELNPLVTTTYGTGTLLKAALDAGAKRIIVGMGGSATVDGGAGCLQALGLRLLNAYGQDVPLGGGSLSAIYTIDTSGLDPRWKDVEVIIASDVTNPAVGEEGAAAVFGPQKGAGPHEVRILESGLRNFFGKVRDHLGSDVLHVPGGGAAGALAAGLMAFLGGHIESGIDLLLDSNGFDAHLQNADLVITGEGQMDEQTLHGKGPIGAARRAKAAGVPTIALVGSLNADDALLHEAGMQAVFPIVTRPMALDEALRYAAELVERAALRLGYVLRLNTQGSLDS